MILKLDYKGDKQGFDLTSELAVDAENDAEALGYITNVLFEAAQRLTKLMQDANPKLHARMSMGVKRATEEKEREQNENYPFTMWYQQDE